MLSYSLLLLQALYVQYVILVEIMNNISLRFPAWILEYLLCTSCTYVSCVCVCVCVFSSALLLHSGEVYMFGHNKHGQLGQGNSKDW